MRSQTRAKAMVGFSSGSTGVIGGQPLRIVIKLSRNCHRAVTKRDYLHGHEGI
jgi:hypothetical protein